MYWCQVYPIPEGSRSYDVIGPRLPRRKSAKQKMSAADQAKVDFIKNIYGSVRMNTIRSRGKDHAGTKPIAGYNAQRQAQDEVRAEDMM